MEPPVRVAVRAPFDSVVDWAAGQPGRCLVTDAGAGWTFVDLDPAGPSGALARFEGPVYEVDLEGDVWVHRPAQDPERLPMYVEDSSDEDEVAAFEEAWSQAPPGLADGDPRLEPPAASQVVMARGVQERDLAACALAEAMDLVHVSGDGWTLVGHAAGHSVGGDPTDMGSAMAVAAGLSANGAGVLVLVAGPELAELVLWRRGRPRARHVWNRRQVLVGQAVAAGDPWLGFELPDVTVEALTEAMGVPSDAGHSLVRATLRRTGAPVPILVELVELVAPGVDSALLSDVLAGRGRLADDPRAAVVRAPSSFLAFLRSSWSTPAPLDPRRVPVYALVCTALLPLLAVLWPVRLWELVHGDIDGWGVAQLVGCTVNLPAAAWQAARVRDWLTRRRHTMRP